MEKKQKQKSLGKVAYEAYWLFDWEDQSVPEKRAWSKVASAVIREYLKRQKAKGKK